MRNAVLDEGKGKQTNANNHASEDDMFCGTTRRTDERKRPSLAYITYVDVYLFAKHSAGGPKESISTRPPRRVRAVHTRQVT